MLTKNGWFLKKTGLSFKVDVLCQRSQLIKEGVKEDVDGLIPIIAND